MANDVKVTAAKAAETKAKEVVKETAKAEAPAKVEAPVKVAAAKKAPAKKVTTKKAPAKKAEAKKPEAKKPAAVASKVSVKVQYQNNEVNVVDVEEKVKAQFVAEGHTATSIKKVEIYVKPEDYSAYYVINEKFSGRVDLF